MLSATATSKSSCENEDSQWITPPFTALVQRYALELEKRCRPHLRRTTDSWRVDETYVKVKWAGCLNATRNETSRPSSSLMNLCNTASQEEGGLSWLTAPGEHAVGQRVVIDDADALVEGQEHTDSEDGQQILALASGGTHLLSEQAWR